MIATHRPTAIATGGGGAYHDNFGAAANPDGHNPLFQFAAFVAGLRRDHPCLRQRKYGDWLMDSGEDVTYQFKRTDGQTDLGEGNRCLWLRIDGSAVGDHDFLLLINMDAYPHHFQIPAHEGQTWVCLIDTAPWAEIQCNFWGAGDARETITDTYEVAAWSIGILEQVAAAL